MTGSEMLTMALNAMGYTDSLGASQTANRFKSRAVMAINSVYADLLRCIGADYDRINTLTDSITFPEGTDDRVLYEIMPYGVAANLAFGEGDGATQGYCATVYNDRKRILARFDTVRDALPEVET